MKMTNGIMDDCKFYEENFHRCMALTEMVCRKKECSFYKPRCTDDTNMGKGDEILKQINMLRTIDIIANICLVMIALFPVGILLKLLMHFQLFQHLFVEFRFQLSSMDLLYNIG